MLIAGSASGVGKTTVTLSILAAMARRGLTAQPFKGGPDFLDTGHLTRISGRIARNIDTWILSLEANVALVRGACAGADALVVEGMMGLFDGKDGKTDAGSSAEIAKLLKLPVVLVLDASKSARSIAATVLGFELFDPELPLAGVILNRVAGERHYQMLATAIRSRCASPVLGWMPAEPAISIAERHLGLQTAEELSDSESTMGQREKLADLAESHLDLDTLLALTCRSEFELEIDDQSSESTAIVRIGIARDKAFSFYYEDNLDLLRQMGATIVPFSPIDGTALPEELDALYIGGGYPELYAEPLSRNALMIAAIREFALSGKPVYAECGGMMYLSRQLTTLDGTGHPMASIFPFEIEMTKRLVNFGYVSVELTQNCLLGERGTQLRGHSFHHSRLVGESATTTNYHLQYSLSGRQEDEGYSFRNVLASYIHLHFGSAPSVAQHLVSKAREFRATREVIA
jgi:cobyrinic acid a,c-diamide synthase